MSRRRRAKPPPRAPRDREQRDADRHVPSNPWVSGVASLFTVQYYERVRERLAPGGVFGQWFHLYEMEDELLLSVLAALDRSFPDWSAWIVSKGDVMIVAGTGPLPEPDWSVLAEPRVRALLSLGPPVTGGQMESLRMFDARAMAPLLADWPANSDYRPVLDSRAERARFLKHAAAGLHSFAADPLDVPRALAGDTLLPVPYDSLSVTDVPPLYSLGLSGWLVTGAARDGTAPIPEWNNALLRAGRRPRTGGSGWTSS